MTISIMILVQFIVLLLLYDKMEKIERDIASDMSAHQVPPFQSMTVQAAAPIESGDGTTYLPEDRFRQIIQEELRAELRHVSQVSQHQETANTNTSLNGSDLEYQRDHVSQKIDYYSSVGSISDLEMQQLQMDIARLDEAGRKEMLRRLIGALNSGSLEGRL